MLSVDTNVLVRLITNDDSSQVATIRSLLSTGPIWISKTVLLEANWVPGSAYRFEASEIRAAFISLMGVQNVHTEDKTAVSNALSLMLNGIDFADALHLSGRPPGTTFLTFDHTLVKRAKRAGVSEISDASTWLSQ